MQANNKEYTKVFFWNIEVYFHTVLKFKVTQNFYIISEMAFTETILDLEFTRELRAWFTL